MKALAGVIRSFREHSSLYVILTAAVLLELVSGIQYFYTRGLLEDELESHAESELTTKAILIKGTLNAAENALSDHVWDALRNLEKPDSLFHVAERLTIAHPLFVSSAVAMRADYYPDRGRWFEPWAGWNGDTLRTEQIGGADHDYLSMTFYTSVVESDSARWSPPYQDEKGGHGLITTYALPLHDVSGEVLGVLGADMSLNWLGDTLNNRRKYNSSFILLLTEDGHLIAGPDEKKVSRDRVNAIVDLINDSTKAHWRSDSGRSDVKPFRDILDGREGFAFYAFMKGRPYWQLALVSYDEEVYGKLNRMSLNILLLSLAGLLLLGYILYRSARNLRRLHAASVEKERINGELRIAQSIQMEMLPTHDQLVADRHDIDVTGTLEPAKEVGGDLYDYFVRDEKLFFCIGDVSGKGVPSALVMAVIHAFFRSSTSHDANPSRIMKKLNEAACEGNGSNMFVTFFVGVLDLPTGRLRYCNGGHDHPFVINGTEVRELQATANLPLGLFNDFDYQMQEEQLTPGAALFLYTDGLTEARNPQRELFGEKRLLQALERMATPELTAPQLLENMSRCVSAFVGEAEQSDDLTMLAIRYTPKSGHTLLHETITLKNEVAEVDRLGAFVKSLTTRLGMDKSLASNLRLAIEEAVVNVIDYAYPTETAGKVTVEADVQEDESDVSGNQHLCIRIIDNGVAFDPTEATQADTTLSAEDRPIGGLGIFLMRELMDSINYERVDGKNVLTLIHKLKNTQPRPLSPEREEI